MSGVPFHFMEHQTPTQLTASQQTPTVTRQSPDTNTTNCCLFPVTNSHQTPTQLTARNINNSLYIVTFPNFHYLIIQDLSPNMDMFFKHSCRGFVSHAHSHDE